MEQQMKEEINESYYKKGYLVFSQRAAGFAMLNDCKLIKIRPDCYDNTKNVFVFYDSLKLQEVLKQYKELHCFKK